MNYFKAYSFDGSLRFEGGHRSGRGYRLNRRKAKKEAEKVKAEVDA